jgi:hypothetical protein
MFGESFDTGGRSATYWLITKNGEGLPGTLTVGLGGGRKALPIFSFPDEADLFLTLGGFAQDGWRADENTCGELFSALADGATGEIEFVALDPLPEMLSGTFGAAIYLVSMSRRRFMRRLARERDFSRSV